MRLLIVMQVAAIFVLSGCAGRHPVTQPAESFHAGYLLKGRNCSIVKTIPAVPVQLGQDLTVHLDATSNCIEVKPGINEPASLFKLPDSNTAYYVTVRTRRERLMLMPRLELLDGERHALDTLTYKNMKPRGQDMSTTFFIKPDKQKPAYLLVYPDPTLIGDQHKRLDQGMTVGYYVFYSMMYGTSRKSTITYVEQGTLEIHLVNYETPALNRSG